MRLACTGLCMPPTYHLAPTARRAASSQLATSACNPPACQLLTPCCRLRAPHLLQEGRIITTGDMTLVDRLEEEGYAVLKST